MDRDLSEASLRTFGYRGIQIAAKHLKVKDRNRSHAELLRDCIAVAPSSAVPLADAPPAEAAPATGPGVQCAVHKVRLPDTAVPGERIDVRLDDGTEWGITVPRGVPGGSTISFGAACVADDAPIEI
jgi:hypothetical protein